MIFQLDYHHSTKSLEGGQYILEGVVLSKRVGLLYIYFNITRLYTNFMLYKQQKRSKKKKNEGKLNIKIIQTSHWNN